jgi:hypothetical protein
MDDAESRVRKGHKSSNADGFIAVERQKAFNRCMGIFDHSKVYRSPATFKSEPEEQEIDFGSD